MALYLMRMSLFVLHVPDSLVTTAKSGSLIAAWAGLFFGLVGTRLALRREWLERIRLAFRFKATFIEEDDPNSDMRFEIDGVPSVEAIIVTVTNLGKGVTIEQCRCEYEASFYDGMRVLTTTAHVREYIEKGKACEGRLRIYSKPIRFKSATAVDSTGKLWPCSQGELVELNTEAEQWWKRTHFQKERSSTDRQLAERQRELKRKKVLAESAAAQDAEKTREREAEQRRKLYSLMRRIDCVESEFEFPPRPTGAVFNNVVIRQINQSIEHIHDALLELVDLPETKAVLEVAIPCSAVDSPPWPELQGIHKKHFLPIQTVYRKLKAEVMGASTQTVG